MKYLDKEGVLDYKQYYGRKNIKYHGNSELYFSNDNISLLDSEGIVVGYERIYHNQLAAASPFISTRECKGLNTSIKRKRTFDLWC